MMDNMPKRGMTFLAEIFESKDVFDHPHLLRTSDNVPVVITFDTHGREVWQKRLELTQQLGAEYFVISDISQILWEERHFGREFSQEKLNKIRNEVQDLDGLYCFADWSPLSLNLLGRIKTMAQSFSPPKIFGGCIVAGYTGAGRQGIIHDFCGTNRFRKQWLDVIEKDPHFVYLTTLNDYSEATEQDCSGNNTFTFIDLNYYFSHRWKHNSWPKLNSEQAFLSYRKTVSVNEAIELELVLLTPQPRGKLDARISLQTSTSSIELATPEIELYPGHVAWRFWLKSGLQCHDFVCPDVQIFEDGKLLSLPKGNPAYFSVLEYGECLSRRWLHVPLHRIAECSPVEMRVNQIIEEGTNRKIEFTHIEHLPVSCGLIELQATPLTPAIPKDKILNGFVDKYYSGPGWAPMNFKIGAYKRSIIDQFDRYTAVIRLDNDTFIYPKPAILTPMYRMSNHPFIDPALVGDWIIAPGAKLYDRSWWNRDLVLAENAVNFMFEDNFYYLNFDAKSSGIAVGPIFMPPGPATLDIVIRPRAGGQYQTIFDSSEPILTLVLTDQNTIALIRYDQHRQEQILFGKTPIAINSWSRISAIFTGNSLELFVNGIIDGSLPIHGLRSDYQTTIGKPARWSQGIRNVNPFLGDIRSLKIYQRPLQAEELT
jgi:hypothetical protein